MNENGPCDSFAPSEILKYVLVKMDRECHNSPAVEKKACKWDQPVVNRFARSWKGLDRSLGVSGTALGSEGESKRREGEVEEGLGGGEDTGS